MSPARDRILLDKLPVFYAADQVARGVQASPSAAKPAALMARWIASDRPLQVLPPKPVTLPDFYRAHDERFVDAIFALELENGFMSISAEVNRSLPYTSGSMLDAAIAAIENGAAAVAPCSGFHHAGYDYCGGFCTFNGLMIAALALQSRGIAGRVGILDFDQHYGDGTDHIIEEVRPRGIVHYTAGKSWQLPQQSTKFLTSITGIVETMRTCDVILYQAGADPHIDDPLGGWLTTDQLKERDRLVFEAASALRIPIAWNLAGGYQTPLEKVLAIHDNTLDACLQVYCGAPQ